MKPFILNNKERLIKSDNGFCNKPYKRLIYKIGKADQRDLHCKILQSRDHSNFTYHSTAQFICVYICVCVYVCARTCTLFSSEALHIFSSE